MHFELDVECAPTVCVDWCRYWPVTISTKLKGELERTENVLTWASLSVCNKQGWHLFLVSLLLYLHKGGEMSKYNARS